MPTHLFVMRLWREEIGPQRDEWRGQVVSVENGEERAFRDPTTLYDVLLRLLADLEDTPDTRNHPTVTGRTPPSDPPTHPTQVEEY